jgi:inhibitor of KinA
MLSIERVSETTIILRAQDANQYGGYIASTAAAIEEALGEAFVEIAPAYTSLMLVVDFPRLRCCEVIEPLRQLLQHSNSRQQTMPKRHRLPIYYGSEVGPDLDELAVKAGISRDDAIALHQEPTYRVKAIGFAPGFAYLDGLPKSLQQARRSNPRTMVAKGSLGLAEDMSAVYPLASPGGWNIIGRCPATLFDPQQQTTELICPFRVGDEVQFYAVSRSEFLELGGALD